MKNLPLSIQTFSKMIQGNYLYVDKTEQILQLITQGGGYFFLSRPRRFGKSLLVSTLKEIFSGNKELFKGLFIYDKIDWKTYPVIYLDFSKIDNTSPDELKQNLLDILNRINDEHQLHIQPVGFKMYFATIIEMLAKKYDSNVVVLIDEYDKPIIDYVDDLQKAKENRDILKNFYGVLKGSDPYLQFVFLTGVSKFSQVSVFSDLNNLNDITLSPQYATLLGYTQEELEHYFADYIDLFCQEKNLSKELSLSKIRMWYNGYSWNATDRVYNPVSILNLFAKKMFRNYWFATGTPTFLINLIKQAKIEVSEFDHKCVSDILFDSYDIDRMDVAVLLFQTGYLTMTDMQEYDYGIEYTLDYPNHEVKEAFLTYLFESFTTNNKSDVQVAAHQLRRCLQRDDLEGFITIIRSLFAKIPYTLHIEEEAYYHSLFYMIAALMGVKINLEVLTDKGRIDGVLEFEDTVYVIEFKYGKVGSDMNKLTNKAIKQIRDKKYAERYLDDPRQRILLGIGFAGKEVGYKIVRDNG